MCLRTVSKGKSMTWFEEYFTKEWMRFRDVEALFEKTPAEVDFLEKALGVSPGAKILDIGCGFGRHVIELAKRGYVVTGTDLSAELLAEAKKLSRKAGVSATWVEQDMRLIDFDAEFDAATCLFTSFGYFDSEEEDVEVLRRVSRSLRRGARFVLDVENRDGLLMRYIPRDWWRTDDGDLVMEKRRFDPVKGRAHTNILLISNGRKTEHNLSIRWYSVPELRRMLEEVGINLVCLHGGLDGSQYDIDAMRLVVIGEKK